MFSMREMWSFKTLDNPTFDYVVSSVTDEETWKRMDTALLAELLNENLPLGKYGAVKGLGRSFFARRIAIRECFDLADPASFIKLLNTQLSLSDFGQGLSEVCLTFQADEPNASVRKMHLEYYPSDKELHVTLPLNTRHLLRKDRRGILNLMAKTLLSASPRLEEAEIPDFAVEKFIWRVEEMFRKEGILE